MSDKPRIAVLGAGIMGSSTALFLARRGAKVTLFDAADTPFSAASRWNEGKIHLGYIYNADPTLQTLHRVLPGGLVFKPLLEDLVGCSIDPVITPTDDIYLCHRESVVEPDMMRHYFQQVDRIVRQHPDAGKYLVDASDSQTTMLSPSQLASISNSPDIIAGFRIPERSVETTWIANRFIDALSSEKQIEQIMGRRVTAVQPESAQAINKNWYVKSSNCRNGPYDFVINALWEGRLAIDTTAGLPPTGSWSNRFRRSLFIHTSEPVDMPSAIIATGPYGDIKNFNNRDFYISWYPAGMMKYSTEISPPIMPPLDETTELEISNKILDKLEEFLPNIIQLRKRIDRMRLEGGWVFAAGQGMLSDIKSTLHRRSDFGIVTMGTYLSIDTGKYSTAPWLAHKVADHILP